MRCCSASICWGFTAILFARSPLAEAWQSAHWPWIAGLGLLGLVIGSFVATLVVRWPQGRSVLRGRSRCDACDTRLAPRDLAPLLSAAFARGRCRHCAAPIKSLHWQIEATALAIGVAAGTVATGPDALAGVAFGWLLLALAALDATEYWLPDTLTGSLAVAGLISGLAGIEPDLTGRLIGGAVGFGLLWAIARLYHATRGRDGLGGGDPKLLGAIGLWLGWQALPIVLLGASLAGLGLVVARLVMRQPVKADDRLPFGALLAAAAFAVWLASAFAGT